MTKKQCPLGEACDLTTAWMAGAAKAKDQIEAQAAEIERLETYRKKTYEGMLEVTRIHDEVEAKLEKMIGGAETVLEAWDHHMRDVVVSASLNDAIEELRADVAEAKGAKP